MTRILTIGDTRIGGNHPFALLAGPCQLESFDHARMLTERIAEACAPAGTRYFTTVEELRQVLAAFAAKYNASWLLERHGYKTPNQIRAEQKPLKPKPPWAVKMAA